METAPDSCCILQVEFLIASTELEVMHLDWQESMQMKDEAFNEIQRRARDTVPALCMKYLTYVDEEGDACTLTKETLLDALSFAAPLADNPCIRSLRLNIHSPDIENSELESSTSARSDMLESVELCAAPTESVEAHVGTEPRRKDSEPECAEIHAVSCNGCSMAPIVGHRFKSLLHDDFNLCQKCFGDTDRQPHEWVQVACAKLDSPIEANFENSFRESKAAHAESAEAENASCSSSDSPIDTNVENAVTEKKESVKACTEAEIQAQESVEVCTEAELQAEEEVVDVGASTAARGNDSEFESPLERATKINSDDEGHVTGFKGVDHVEEALVHIAEEVAQSALAKAEGELNEADMVAHSAENVLEDKEVELQVGALLLYRKVPETTGTIVTLVKVHYDDHPPYCTIRMPDGREKQTIRANLVSCRQEVDSIAEDMSNQTDNASHEILHLSQDAVICKHAIELLLSNPSEEVRNLVRENLVAAVAMKEVAADTSSEVGGHHQEDRVPTMPIGSDEVEPSIACSPNDAQSIDENASKAPVDIISTSEDEKAIGESTSKTSARVTGSDDLVLGIEAWEDADARGDVTSEFGEVVALCQVSQVYRIGRMMISATEDIATSVPVSAKIKVMNDGEGSWPESVALMHKSGPSCDCSFVQLGALRPGEVEEIVMDLSVPVASGVGTSRSLSVWTIAEGASGKPLGAALCFEVFWE